MLVLTSIKWILILFIFFFGVNFILTRYEDCKEISKETRKLRQNIWEIFKLILIIIYLDFKYLKTEYTKEMPLMNLACRSGDPQKLLAYQTSKSERPIVVSSFLK